MDLVVGAAAGTLPVNGASVPLTPAPPTPPTPPMLQKARRAQSQKVAKVICGRPSEITRKIRKRQQPLTILILGTWGLLTRVKTKIQSPALMTGVASERRTRKARRRVRLTTSVQKQTIPLLEWR